MPYLRALADAEKHWAQFGTACDMRTRAILVQSIVDEVERHIPIFKAFEVVKDPEARVLKKEIARATVFAKMITTAPRPR